MSLREQATFVGRAAELSLIDELLVDDPPASVVLVHGPGGIGKSALLRAVARRARHAGRSTVMIEGRELPPLPHAVEEAIAPAHEVAGPVVLIDSYEHMAALGAHLRRAVLPTLPERAIVVMAGRGPPDPGWFEGGWDRLTREVELGPLAPDEAAALLRAHGVAEPARIGEMVAWAAGSPLALTFVARTADAPTWRPGQGGEPRELVRTLVRRLAEGELDEQHRGVLWLACIARVTTTRLIGDVLPDVDADEAMAWLSGRTFTEPLADGVTLHELVRRAVRADLRQREPERERHLRRRIADSVHARAVADRPFLTMDLAELVETPEIRAFYGWEGAARNRIDAVRPGDAAEVARQLQLLDGAEWWDMTRPFFEQAPHVVAVARDAADQLCGYAITVTPASAPPVARQDPLLGSWLRHASEVAPDGNVLLCRDAVDFTRDAGSRIQAMINVSSVLRSGLPNPRYLYLPVDPTRDDIVAFMTALGARHHPELDRPAAKSRIVCYVLDCGPGGVLGRQLDVIYAELGLAPPGRHGPSPGSPDPGTVREALRNLHLPHALAQSPLARSPLAGDHGVDERAAAVRRRLERAVERAFGETESERLLQQVLLRGYFDPRSSHERTALDLNLSRAAYFRRLKLASERLASYIASEPETS